MVRDAKRLTSLTIALLAPRLVEPKNMQRTTAIQTIHQVQIMNLDLTLELITSYLNKPRKWATSHPMTYSYCINLLALLIKLNADAVGWVGIDGVQHFHFWPAI